MIHILQPLTQTAMPQLPQVWFVIQRANGHWSPAAKIIAVHECEQDAEQQAAAEKRQHPQQCFGVATLRSEAREVANPIEIVKVERN